jgi:hypothetical protein
MSNDDQPKKQYVPVWLPEPLVTALEIEARLNGEDRSKLIRRVLLERQIRRVHRRSLKRYRGGKK